MTPSPSDVVAAAIDATDTEFAVVDAAGTIVHVNDAWRRFADANHGTDRDYWVGANYLEISRQAYDDPRAAEAVGGLRAILDGGDEPLRIEYPCHSPDEHRWFVMEAAGFVHAGDRYAVVTHHDVTDRKLAELRSNAREEQLETLLAVLTHDIRNPLNVIEGYADLLAADAWNADAAERIHRAVDRIATVTEATLTFTQSGALSTVEPVGIPEAAREAWRAVDTGEATLSIGSATTIHGDRRLLGQLFEALFRNAIAYAGSDCTVTIGPLPDGFYVEDDGEGVPEPVRTVAIQADFSTRGTGGLGLAIVRTVVQAHGGTLTITDATGGGARFEIRNVDVAPA